jgi:polar amino acid transport system substrate-binding protein
MRILTFIFICLLYIISVTSCEQYPMDPGKTLEKVQNNVLRAGITESPPYVVIKNNVPSGIEVDIIKGLYGIILPGIIAVAFS